MGPSSRRVLIALVLMFTGTFAVGLALGDALSPSSWLPWRTDAAADYGIDRGPATPVRLVIPSLGVDAPVDPLGLNDDGAIAAPPLEQADRTGWYRDGPAPGQRGAAVIVGHVDDRTGPAVFHQVGALPAGARIEVTRQDGSQVLFEVTDVRTYPKERLPDEVYGDFSEPALRLITCGGRWVGGQTGYADNVIVFATRLG